MKQIIQNYRSGEIELAEVPVPVCTSDTVLVRNIASLISIGTEKSIVELGRKGLLGKARARPDLVRRFVEKARKEGLLKTFNEAMGRLDTATPLGYSSAGIVIETGANVSAFSPGDRVACIGAGYASHAEYVRVPANLCCRLNDHLSFEEGAFGMLGIIALHGVRCARLSFGESAGVMGLGLLGLLTVQLLKSYGCRVIATDIDPAKVELARTLGVDAALVSGSGLDSETFKKSCETFTDGYGLDAVILTLATGSAEPVDTAVDISKFGGRIVVTGVADIHPQRNELWHKEVEIVVSKAGGPGIFDPYYENRNIDYPFGYIRWTEGRNLAEFLRLLSDERVNVKALISHRYKFSESATAYQGILNRSDKTYIGVMLGYDCRDGSLEPQERKVVLKQRPPEEGGTGAIPLGVIGAGLFGKALLLPALRKIAGFRLETLATSSAPNALHAARKYGFSVCTTDYRQVIEDPKLQAVLIAAPHSLHATLVTESLRAGKHVFVEKPLCIREEELAEVMDAYSEIGSSRCLMVGYNRRFSPHAARVRAQFEGRRDPLVINYRVNAGFVPSEHWVHSEEEGGGRIIGEICHFIDLMQYFTGSSPVRVWAERVTGNNRTTLSNDNVVISLKFGEGSIGNIVYAASGDRSLCREQIEIFCEGASVVIQDFKQTHFYRNGRRTAYRTFNQEMGYLQELYNFAEAIRGSSAPGLTPSELFLSTRALFCIKNSLERSMPVPVEPLENL